MPSSTTELLDDCLEVEALREPDGLPYALLGKTPIIHVPTAREWLFGRMRNPNRRRRSSAPGAAR